MIINCLVCHEEIVPKIGWSYLFSKEEPQTLCDVCKLKFTKIEGETCRKCDRLLEGLEFKVEDQCLDCVRWEEDPEWAGCLEKNHSLVIYNDFCKEVIARFKFRGDYIIAQVWENLIQEKLPSIPYDHLVPIPLSEERLYERGFNQSEALIHAIGGEPARLLARTHTEKQSKKSRSERIHLQQVFQIAATEQIPNKELLLIDDIYTTGSTLRHAAKLLKEAGAQSVSSLTIARG